MSMQRRAGTSEKQKRIHPVYGKLQNHSKSSLLLIATPLECDSAVPPTTRNCIPQPVESEFSHEACFGLFGS